MDEAGFQFGGDLEVEVLEEQIIIGKVAEKYTLKGLLRGVSKGTCQLTKDERAFLNSTVVKEKIEE